MFHREDAEIACEKLAKKNGEGTTHIFSKKITRDWFGDLPDHYAMGSSWPCAITTQETKYGKVKRNTCITVSLHAGLRDGMLNVFTKAIPMTPLPGERVIPAWKTATEGTIRVMKCGHSDLKKEKTIRKLIMVLNRLNLDHFLTSQRCMNMVTATFNGDEIHVRCGACKLVRESSCKSCMGDIMKKKKRRAAPPAAANRKVKLQRK